MVARTAVKSLAASAAMLLFLAGANAKQASTIPAGSKVYIAPMDGFETYVKDALEKKKVPLTVVDKKEDAAYEISGTASSQKASTAKKIIMGSWHSKENASIQMADLKTGVVVFAYSYGTANSTHGKRSSAEACAKHLKDAIKPE